ncbi:MAG: DUF2628 domain-containing protein [Clostridia bacterium]|nr:DUF2628 domain-containing protein [Clostridia bacterium]
MNRYEGLCCPVCHGKLFEDDDIAVCPDCGAPHHRECYKSEGHCHFEDKHNTDEQWQMPKREEPLQEPTESDTIKCRVCGNEMPKSNLFCPKCGNSTAEKTQPPHFVHINMGGVNIDKNEEIDGFKTQEIAAFVGHNYLRYINIFKRMSVTKSKTSWNWLAFLIPEYWFFSRKLYKEGFLACVLSAAYSTLLIVLGMSPQNMAYPQETLNISKQALMIAFGASAVMLLIKALFGLFADYIYKKKVFKGLADLKERGENDPFAIMQAGGVNVFACVAAWFILDMLVLFIEMLIM